MVRLFPLAMLVATLLVPACAPARIAQLQSAHPAAPVPSAQASGTRVLDGNGLARLLANKGITLQWIGWDHRGSLNGRMAGQALLLTGAQAQSMAAGGGGRLFLDGVVEEIGKDYFTLRGTIRIENAPDPGRRCEQTKTWRFAITQDRPYYRLREFEWCDSLTDYIDIYF